MPEHSPGHHQLDPIVASGRIEQDYRSYLTTTFAPLDVALRSDFVTALSQPGRVRKGPYLQATAPFQLGATVNSLVQEQLLHADFLSPTQVALPRDRPLYRHQERALRKADSSTNMIVATGTGSGKTECYLLPILNHLLRERDSGTLSQPGVRALLLYPMNALANDQMKRIRDLFAPYPDVTFGRYVGDTDADPAKALAKYRQQLRSEPPRGELIDRPAMQARPPHVLLTNFAMLEYLLLRPADSSLFDGRTGRQWRFIVLDEVHVYDGAKGAEVAMLLRRLRDRVLHSERGALLCIGTSATLGRGAEDSPAVASFAEALFDEPFSAHDVVHPEHLPLQQAAGSWMLGGDQLEALHNAWLSDANGEALFNSVGRTAGGNQTDDVALALWQLLHDEHHVLDLQARLERSSAELSALRQLTSDQSDPDRALVQLVDLCVAARRDSFSAPLIPARYHLWLRAAEGSFVCLHPNHPPDWPRVRLDRSDHCPHCAHVAVESRTFEMAVCRHCRRHLLTGRHEDGKFTLASGFEQNLVFLQTQETDSGDGEVDEDEESVEGDVPVDATARQLCLGCGHLSDKQEECSCSRSTWISVTQVTRNKGESLRRCPSCKRHSRAGVAARFLSGSEAPVSVIATSLYQSLPAGNPQTRRPSAGGRKLLMFSDSRQDAAFFAPYLARTYSRALERRLIWNQLSAAVEPMRFEELLQSVRGSAERLGVLDEENRPANTAEVKAWLLAEIIATDRRQSLDGVGLAELRPWLSPRVAAPVALDGFGLSSDSSLDLLRVLLDSVRQTACVTVPDDVDVREDPRFGPRNTSTWLRGNIATPGVVAWVPSRGLNRRVDFLSRLTARGGMKIDVINVLRKLWDELTNPDGDYARTLVSNDVRSLGTVYALDHLKFEFAPHSAAAQPYRCDTCRQIVWRNVLDVCPTYRCEGSLVPIDRSEENHYLSLYERLEPLPLTVEEHTGQLRPSRAAELQEKFIRGELNALSCSTTFELGVDVGEVQAVLLRNVPPSASNYVQRAGRAGRRLGSAALVVAFAQRRSHDRAYYDNPLQMIDGTILAPFIATDNEAIVRRHVHAVAFAQFERERVNRGEYPVRTMADLIADGATGSVADRFVGWMKSKPRDLGEALARIVPSTVASAVGLETWAWVDRLLEPDETGTGGWYADLVLRVRNDLLELGALELEASEEKKHKVADVMQRAQKTIGDRRVIDQFAQSGVLPKYGFPVDVVELDVSRTPSGARLELNRDLRLGILEFAPGAQIVAANQLWRSVGIKQMPGRELPLVHWGICDGCGALRTEFAREDEAAGGLAGPCKHCGNDQFAQGKRGKFITPIFGFVGQSDGKRPGESRPPREGHLETFFTEFDGPPPERELLSLGGRSLAIRTSKRGWITVFNRGRGNRGFFYCSWCGYAQDSPAKQNRKTGEWPVHDRPTSGKPCSGSLRKVDLGHRFMTNVVELDLPLDGLAWEQDVSAMSALHALMAAAPSIGIAQNDIGGSLAVGEHGTPVVVIFDDVPGGAGHSHHLRAHLGELVTSAIERTKACSCGSDTSCYGCLRSFRNQSFHDDLIRQAALDVLERLR
jgi:ATP-dependent helicase YprA (DUF1998 family)